MSDSEGESDYLSYSDDTEYSMGEQHWGPTSNTNPVLQPVPEDGVLVIETVSAAGTPIIPQDPGQSAREVAESVTSQATSARTAEGSARRVIWKPNHWNHFTDKVWDGDDFIQFSNGLRFPKWLMEEKAINILDEELVTSEQKNGIRQFKTWLRGLNPEQLEDGDRYRFERCIERVAGHWRIMLQKLSKGGNEADQRFPVDCLIETAFCLRRETGHIYRQQANLVLPGKPDCVIADGIETIEVPMDWDDDMSAFKGRHVFSWSWTPSEQLPSVITFAFEAKQDNLRVVKRQLMQDFYSAQMHRRALRLKDGPVFGAILNRGVVSFYVSVWKGEELFAYSVFEDYQLKSLARFIKCYFVLCLIADYQATWLENEFKRIDEDWKKHLNELKESTEKPWRNPERDPQNRRGSPGTKRPAEGGGSQRGSKRRATGGNPTDDSLEYEADLLAKRIMDDDPTLGGVYLLSEVNVRALGKILGVRESKTAPQRTNPEFERTAGWAKETAKFADDIKAMYPTRSVASQTVDRIGAIEESFVREANDSAKGADTPTVAVPKSNEVNAELDDVAPIDTKVPPVGWAPEFATIARETTLPDVDTASNTSTRSSEVMPRDLCDDDIGLSHLDSGEDGAKASSAFGLGRAVIDVLAPPEIVETGTIALKDPARLFAGRYTFASFSGRGDS